MSTIKLSNIPLKTFREFLIFHNCRQIRTNGGHEVWSRTDLLRPIILQTHINPIPEFIIKIILKQLTLTKQDFIDWISSPAT